MLLLQFINKIPMKNESRSTLRPALGLGLPLTALAAALAGSLSAATFTYLDGGTSYTIVEADTMDAAQALTSGHPFLSDGKGAYAIDIYELMPVPDMG